MPFHAVIPAGGSGTRLWPLSRKGAPKFLHPLGSGERSLLQSTVDRLASVAPYDRILVVCGAAHAAHVARQLDQIPAGNIVVEPGPRNSAPAIGLAAAIIARRDPDAVMGSFASDHLVADEAAFVAAVTTAIEVAETGRLVTVGITPTRPETGYGYIRQGESLGIGAARAVLEFAEKPSLEVAEKYVADGYLWNASMFVWQAAALLDQIDKRLPELGIGLRRIAEAWDTADADSVLAEVWPTLPKISIDHAVVEGAAADGQVATVPAELGWNDVGDWHTLGDVLPAESGQPVVLGRAEQVVALDAPGCVVVTRSAGAGRMVAVLGVANLVVVDTDDAVLVMGRDQAQRVREVVDELDRRGRTDLL